MHSIIENNKKGITELCKKHCIKTLYVFGSVVNNYFANDSDIDFLYTIDLENFPEWDKGDYDYTDNILSFENDLNQLLQRKVDLVPDLPIKNKYFKASVDATKKLIYAA
jgi:uncharacterized protein